MIQQKIVIGEMEAPEEKRREMYKEHVIQSIETLRKKVSMEYDFDGLMRDVRMLLE